MAASEYTMNVTSKGQVTIPLAVRRMLGIRRNSKVTFRVQGDTVTIEPAEYSLESVFGAVTPLARPEDFERLAQVAFDEHTARVTEGD